MDGRSPSFRYRNEDFLHQKRRRLQREGKIPTNVDNLRSFSNFLEKKKRFLVPSSRVSDYLQIIHSDIDPPRKEIYVEISVFTWIGDHTQHLLGLLMIEFQKNMSIAPLIKRTQGLEIYGVKDLHKEMILSLWKEWVNLYEAIGKSRKPDSEFNAVQLALGTKVELEHTSDKSIAKKIAKDHLEEHPDYYKALRLMEKELEEGR